MAAAALVRAPRDSAHQDGPAPAFRGGAAPAVRVQRAALTVSSPQDSAEREASRVAERVVRMPTPVRLASANPVLARSAVHAQRAAIAPAAVAPADTAARIQARKGGGQPLPAPLRRFMEPRFGADFSAVRLHTDEEAARLSQRLGARAFTAGGDVFFGRGEYQPGSEAGRELIAHELAHTVQQGAARQAATRAAAPTLQREALPVMQREALPEPPALTPQPAGLLQRIAIPDRILEGLATLAANVPGFTLLTLVLGRNPITGRAVERNVVNLLRAFIGLIPGGEQLFQVLQRQGIVDRIGQWVQTQTAALGLSFQTVRDAFTRFTDSLGFTDIFSPEDVWQRARSIFSPLVDRVTGFVSRLVTQAVTWLKETFMAPLSGFARQIPGYGLVTVMLGRDPFTDAPVPRTALAVVRAFAEFIPGGTEKVDQLVQSGALERANAWLQAETAARNLTWARVTGTFAAAWAGLQLADVLQPVATVERLAGLFRPLLADLVSFAGAALGKLLELIYEAAMGAGGRRVLDILMRARATFLVIIGNPVGFLRNLLGAVGQGVRQFMTNILTHLRDGVIAWLTGPVARAGIQVPERWDLRGIIGFVLQILGLSWANVRGKLVRLIGEPAMATLERGFALITDIRERGLVVALRERVTEFFGNLRESALGAIRSFIQERIVMAGITQLLSMLIPVAAILQAIQKTYTTIQFFIQRINQILDFVESIVNSIAAIASGAIGAAANFVERTMARTIPVILDFLARFIGLGDVGAQVQTTIRTLQARVDGMLDRAVEWIRNQASRLGRAIAGGARRLVGAIAQWWRVRQPVRTRSGATHEIAIEGDASNAQIVVHSETKYLDALIRTIPSNRRAPATRLKNEVLELVRRGRSHASDTSRGGVDEAELNRISREMATKLREISDILVETGALDEGATSPAALPTPTYSFQTRNGLAHEALVTNLSANRPMGSTPFEDPAGWDYVQASGQVSGHGRFVRMHLINHRFGGLGRAANLAPGPTESNRLHLDTVETPIKALVGDLPLQAGKTAIVRSYKVTVQYRSARALRWPATGAAAVTANMSSFPESFVCEWDWTGAPASPGPVSGRRRVPVPIGAPLRQDQV